MKAFILYVDFLMSFKFLDVEGFKLTDLPQLFLLLLEERE
jgi:hypothetical protein